MAPLDSVGAAIEELRRGRMVVVCGGAGGGALVLPARFATPDAVELMAARARGPLCLALTAERARELELDPPRAGSEPPRAGAAVSIEAASGVPGRDSGADRAHTIQVAIDPASRAGDLRRPGHVFPLQALPGGVLERAGQAEAAIDLTEMAGLGAAAVLCEIVGPDGPLSAPQLEAHCRRHGLKLVPIADLVAHRRRAERPVERVVSTRLPTRFGEFVAIGYRARRDGGEHLAVVKGEVAGAEGVLVHLHSGCRAGDVFHGRGCSCRAALEQALVAIEREGRGVVLYLAGSEGGSAGLAPDGGCRVQRETREYGAGAQILADLGPSSIRLLADTPAPVSALERHGLTVAGQVRLRLAQSQWPRSGRPVSLIPACAL